MRNILLKLLVLGCVPVQVGATEFVQNGGFESSSVGPGEKKTFVSANEQFWTGGGNITYVAAPGTADNVNLTPYVRPGFPANSPAGGNFVMADGATGFNGAFSQAITNLVIGKVYTLTFYQAAAQAYNFTGNTTEWWDVTFGGVTQQSTFMNTPSAAFTPWQTQTMSFIASTTSQTLTFLARGAPDGGPPISFLDGVSLIDAAVPEPAIWATMFLGFGLVGTAMRARRSPRAAAQG